MTDLIKIAVDAMGGDNSPNKIIDGITLNHSQNKNLFYIMNNNKITSVFVIKHNSKVAEGIIHIHDCIKIG